MEQEKQCPQHENDDPLCTMNSLKALADGTATVEQQKRLTKKFHEYREQAYVFRTIATLLGPIVALLFAYKEHQDRQTKEDAFVSQFETPKSVN